MQQPARPTKEQYAQMIVTISNQIGKAKLNDQINIALDAITDVTNQVINEAMQSIVENPEQIQGEAGEYLQAIIRPVEDEEGNTNYQSNDATFFEILHAELLVRFLINLSGAIAKNGMLWNLETHNNLRSDPADYTFDLKEGYKSTLNAGAMPHQTMPLQVTATFTVQPLLNS